LSYSIKGELEKRLELAEKALELNPNHARSNYSYGQALTNSGRFKESLEYVLKAIELDPISKKGYEGFFPFLYIGLNDWDNAINWCNTLNERTPHSRWLGWKAAVYGKMGNLSLAKENLSMFLAERPEIKNISDYEKVAPTIVKDILLEGMSLAGLKE
jgi:tetratricopeptide (TPR) repeat protein